MAVRAIIAVNHLPQNDTSWANYATHGLTRGADQSVSNTIVNGWIVSNSTTAGLERITIPLDPYLAAPTAKLWVSVKARVTALVNNQAGIIYFGGTFLIRAAAITNLVLNKEYCLEFSYTFATGNVECLCDGVSIGGLNVGAGLRSFSFGLEAKGSVANQIDWSDIIISDDQASLGQPTGPYTSWKNYPVTLNAATGTNWTTNPAGGSLVAALSEPGAVPTTKIAVAPSPVMPLTTRLLSAIPASRAAYAIELNAGLGSTTGAVIAVAGKLNEGGTDLAGTSANAAATGYSYSGSLGVFHKGPLGEKLTKTSIGNIDLVTTPAGVVNVANIQGYAVTYALPPLPKGVTGRQALLNLIAATAKPVRVPANFTAAAPDVLTGNANFNTQVVVGSTVGSGLRGSWTMFYNRVDLTRMFDDPLSLTIGSEVKILDLLPKLVTASGMTINADDIVDGDIVSGSTSVTLTAAATSRFFIPGSTFLVGRDIPNISTEFPNPVLNGFL
jgi:hypothetical protein